MRALGTSLARTGGIALLIAAAALAPAPVGETALAADGEGEAREPEAGLDERCLLGWIPFWDQERAMDSFRRNVELFNTISFFWYYLDGEGSIQQYSKARFDPLAIEFARRHGVKTLALVANSPDDAAPAWHELTARALGQLLPDKSGTEWDGSRVAQTIREDASRARHIADLVALAETNGFDGINIDYEELGRDDREVFSRFIQELGAALHERGKILAVGLHPKTSEDNPRETNGSEAQDWNAIEPAADQLHFITYGEYVPRLEPGPTGPIASPGWIHAVMDYALNVRKLPREKIFIGVGLYAESWYRVGARRYVGEGLELTYEDILTLEQSFKGERHWHDESASPYLSYRDPEGYWRVVWFEDARSVREKLRLRSELGICNVGVWRLGGEDPAVWRELATPPIESSLLSNDLELDRQGELR